MHGQWGRFAELYHCQLGISYPTVRSRLHELIERLKEQPAGDEERKR